MMPEKKIAKLGIAAECLRQRVGFLGRRLLSSRLTLFHQGKIDEIVEEIHSFKRRSRPGN